MSSRSYLNDLSASRIANADAAGRPAPAKKRDDIFTQDACVTSNPPRLMRTPAQKEAAERAAALEERVAARHLVRSVMGAHACQDPSCGDAHPIGGHGCAGPGCALPGHQEAARAARELLDGFRFDREQWRRYALEGAA